MLKVIARHTLSDGGQSFGPPRPAKQFTGDPDNWIDGITWGGPQLGYLLQLHAGGLLYHRIEIGDYVVRCDSQTYVAEQKLFATLYGPVGEKDKNGWSLFRARSVRPPGEPECYGVRFDPDAGQSHPSVRQLVVGDTGKVVYFLGRDGGWGEINPGDYIIWDELPKGKAFLRRLDPKSFRASYVIADCSDQAVIGVEAPFIIEVGK